MEWVKIIIPIVPLVLKPLKVVAKHVAYPFKVSNNINSLESETQKLRAAKEDVQTIITNAERENGAPTEQVKLWLDEVEAIEQKAEEIQQNYQQLCRYLWNISPNLWSNYKISRSAAKNQVKVKSLCVNRDTIGVIFQMPPRLAQEMPVSSSKSSNLEQALEDIKDDAHNIIGIWGMGGVGKTHLLQQINNELSRDDAFDVVIFLTCSTECYEEKVQDKIIEKLGLNKSDDWEQKQFIIFNFLRSKSFVILLDDLWNHVDLKKIGIPNLIGKRKVVLTTRSEEVCRKMEARRNIKVNVLNWHDAWSLFKEKATVETIKSHPLIKKYAEDIVNKLGGLPLALITVGRAMYGKQDPETWEHVVTRLQQARLNDVSEESVLHTLSLSYENLENNTLKQCFLHSALWPEDHKIDINTLIELWMGLGFIDEPEIHSAYNTGYEYIGKLQSACLLEKVSEYCVKLHDVIRDMALWIACNKGVENCKWIVHAGAKKQSQFIKVPLDTEKLSVMRTRIQKLAFSLAYSPTKLSTLLLNNNDLRDTGTLKLESFCELRVLDLSSNHFETFPIEICKLIHLQYLNLSYDLCGMMALPIEFGQLINLKYLFLSGLKCTIAKGVISKLEALRVLRTSYMSISGDIEEHYGTFTSLDKELQCLSDFQALEITISDMHDFRELSQTSVPVTKLEVNSMEGEKCISFSSCFLGNPQLQNNLNYISLKFLDTLKWVKFEKISDDQSICQLGRLECLHFFFMENIKKVIWKGLHPGEVFPRLQCLNFHLCYHLKSISWVVCLPCIQTITICFCVNIKQLICVRELTNNGILISQPSFPFLKKIILLENHKLKSISDPIITFPSLEKLKVERCNKLKKLPFKTDNPPKELVLRGTEEWWNNIEMEDSGHRSLLQPYFHKEEYMD